MPLPSGRALALDARPAVVGVINVTDDSFSDGGRLYPERHPDAAVAWGRGLLAEGADMLDIGGESTRPGSRGVPEEEEARRTLPVLERLAADGAVCSVDTRKPGIARAAMAAGAQVINDVSGARDPALLEAAAETGAAYVLMHMRGTPADMQRLTGYDDVVAEVYEFLAAGLERCVSAGIPVDRVLVDPGIGFAKTAEHNLTLLRSLRQLRGLGSGVFVGASRKSFLGALTAADPDEPVPVEDRLEASLACAALAVAGGVAMIRVHDVAATVRTARVARAITTGQQDWPQLVTES
ncbi:MAG: dihydropteroate synthase [Nitriliruptorales bacterium]|nr:dihydropteroate synthase [Nitriliruptorales bacterium]